MMIKFAKMKDVCLRLKGLDLFICEASKLKVFIYKVILNPEKYIYCLLTLTQFKGLHYMMS